MYTRKMPIISLLIILLVIPACVFMTGLTPSSPSKVDLTPSSNFLSSLSPTTFIEVSPTPLATSTGTFPSFAELHAGDYILYYQQGLYAISADSSIQQKYTDLDGIPVSSDVSLIMAGFKIYDLRTHTILDTSTDSNFYDCAVFSSSSDHINFVAKCRDGNLYVISTDKSKPKILINLRDSVDDRFENPIWSPDGKWISYIRSIPDPNFQSSVGISQLFLVDTICLTDPATCPKKARGPINGNFFVGLSPYSWSPDSREIAIPSASSSSILIYALQANSIREIPWDTGIYSVAWSPDGKSLAFSGLASTNQINIQVYLMPVSGGKAIQLTSGSEDKTLIFWIRVP